MTIKNSDHLKQLTRELTKVGVKPEVERTNGDHMRLFWEIDGTRQSITTSSTPSDHRSTLNARARIRKLLREANAYNDRDQKPQAMLHYALQLPAEPPEPLHLRVQQLEADFDALLDIFIMRIGLEQENKAFEAGWQACAENVQKALVSGKQEPSVKTLTPRKRDKPLWILWHLRREDWLSPKEISKGCGKPTAKIYPALYLARDKGLAEQRSEDKKWRRIGNG